jgi:hypothetical protein
MTEVEQLRQELAEVKTAFGNFACQVMAVAISGLADAAIISNQPMNEHHSLAAVEQLANYARELRGNNGNVEGSSRQNSTVPTPNV